MGLLEHLIKRIRDPRARDLRLGCVHDRVAVRVVGALLVDGQAREVRNGSG